MDSTVSQRFYVRKDVLRRLGLNEAILYRCFEVLPDGGYVVQSADRVRLPFSTSEVERLERQYWELFCEVPPEERGDLHPTVEAAIERFDEEFK